MQLLIYCTVLTDSHQLFPLSPPVHCPQQTLQSMNLLILPLEDIADSSMVDNPKL